MRCTLLLTLAGVLASSSANLLLTRQALPNCAATCLANADYGSCQPTDNACLCSNTAFVQSSTACIEKTCTGSDLTTAEAAAQALCAQVGVTLSPPPSGSATATAPAASGTGSAAAGSTTSASAAPASTSKSAAKSNNANSFVGAVALGLAALAF